MDSIIGINVFKHQCAGIVPKIIGMNRDTQIHLPDMKKTDETLKHVWVGRHLEITMLTEEEVIAGNTLTKDHDTSKDIIKAAQCILDLPTDLLGQGHQAQVPDINT